MPSDSPWTSTRAPSLMHVGAPGTFPSDGAGCCRGHCGGCCPHVANTSPPSGAEADCACGFDAVLCFLLGGFCGGAAGASAAAAAWLSAASQGVSTAKHPPPPCWGSWAACAASGDISARAGPSPGRGMRNIARQAEHSHSGGRLSCQGALHQLWRRHNPRHSRLLARWHAAQR